MAATAAGALTQSSATATVAAGSVCLPSTTPADLDRLFAGEPGGVVGADYQRTTSLPDGRVLWTFQDAEVRRPNGTTTLVHNIGMVQEGRCFTVLRKGTAENPEPWLFASATAPFARWYWPLGAEVGSDGRVYVFAAEMLERGPGYLSRAEPTSTAVAVVDPTTFEVVATAAPGNSSAALYGFSIQSDNTWTYLFAQCHRQFGFDPFFDVFVHDFGCSNRVTVGRVPKGQLLAAPTYWTGGGWSPDPAAAVPILPTANRLVNASQFIRVDNNWMAITKVGDWWGDRILVERAIRATGPYSVVLDLAATPKCVECNTYFASWVPSATPGQLVFGLSHNRWDGIASAVYRPSFGAIAAPGYIVLPAERCSLGHCG